MSKPSEISGKKSIALLLILLGIIARLAPHPSNVTPITAIALFSCAYLPKRWGIFLALTAVIASDLLIGLHEVIAFTWGSFLLTGIIGWWVGNDPKAKRIAIASVAGSSLFFAVTNFGVWLMQDGIMYSKDAAGLLGCYLAGIPFYRNALFGDMAWSFLIFGMYRLAMASSKRKSIATS
jgi:hypothetical protein